MLSHEAQKWNERQERAREYHATEGRALRDIERNLSAIRSLLERLVKHFGVRP
jgi:predicted  nucleic acid-binding Zn-ribbon protein